ncbi:hypothetical protein HN419_02010 [Candidatus Woesearchaeota archaeon]|jgi:uncharacterized protein (UPF0333 family)|nr:hypothetical protein [Candidatus Woesearchaeota archaeon]MBT3537228.1 hypothetical protein [Candidatus Woesearchaeota archaeon]MBT4698215.1 hypothetical protein [Candidatus Woesearchaeota archaeon]MBT4717740.1 hypothetical protein [Candidatus Woesearchaeota archaeon]MBT7106462.1 hypothetical protein [Candidatus Woesearchaeota archaeon]
MMFKKGAVETSYVVMIIIGLLALGIIAFFFFNASERADKSFGSKFTCVGHCVSKSVCDTKGQCMGSCNKIEGGSAYCCVGKLKDGVQDTPCA